MSIQFSRPVVIAIAAVFAVLLGWGIWSKLNQQGNRQAYFRDAARLQAEEKFVTETDAKGNKVVSPPTPNDKAYQPESGHID